MTKRLAPYGSDDRAGDVAKVGKSKTSPSLAARMPSPEVAAKVGEIGTSALQSHRVVRRNRTS